MHIASLFSGIGGLELGLEAAIPGAEVKVQVELDPYARGVLAKHWPEARRFDDIRTVRASDLQGVSLICGGFPCQDLSVAGKGAGLDGERSGLWEEFARLVREVRPRFIVVENVPALRWRGLGRVLGDLASAGYDAEWESRSAASVGAWHKRERLFIIAYPDAESREGEAKAPHPLRPRLEGQQQPSGAKEKHATARDSRRWAAEPKLGRVAYGIPGRVDRLRCLGNAVVPQVAYRIGLRVRELVEQGY